MEYFENKYLPLENNDNSFLFETYGDDLKLVQSKPNHLIWTVIDCDGDLRLMQGFHHVNRINYIIATKPYFEGDKSEYTYPI